MPNQPAGGPMAGFAYAENPEHFLEHKLDAVPYRIIPDPNGGWLVSCAWGDDPTTGTRFGEVFHLTTNDELAAFLTQSFSYWSERRAKNLERANAIRDARIATGGRKPRKLVGDPLAKLALGDIKLKL